MRRGDWSHALPALLLAAVLGAGAIPARAADQPRAYQASPETYRVIAERGQDRVIMVAWAPGHRDAWHSHPAASGYFLTDCSLRFHFPDGRQVDQAIRAGAAFVQPATASHSVENRAEGECRLVMFERE